MLSGFRMRKKCESSLYYQQDLIKMAIAEKHKYTYQDYLNTPDDTRYELIEGKLIMMTPAPTTQHQRISRKIEFILDKYITENELGEIFDAPYDVVLDNENVLQPDLLFISKDKMHIIEKKNIKGAPELVIEIISESTAYHDMIKKKQLYARFGIKEYWIVIPEESAIELYYLKDSSYQLHKKFLLPDIFESPLFPSLQFSLTQIF